MPCRFFHVNTASDTKDFFSLLKDRSDPKKSATADTSVSVEKTVSKILANVQENGLSAILEYTKKFDAPNFSASQFCVPESELLYAANAISDEHKETILDAADNIRAFHQQQKENSWFTTREDGSILGQMARPVDRAGLYIPGGKGGMTPLISSLLMNVIPAQIAGVDEIAIISPPMSDGTVNRYILAAAHLLGVNEVYAVGSAWGIAALAYGAGNLKPVDVIAGPGNIFVTTAKRLLIGTVGIDMLAGPSEVLVIADETANPEWIAADMLSQAEHDSLASAVCLCTSEALAKKTQEALIVQCELLPRKDIALESLKAYGAIMYTPSLDVAIDIANGIAAEHLELLVRDPWAILPRIRHAGAVFMGHYSAEPLGDYYAGPNHVLPTMGTARFSSALGVATFMKKTSVIAASEAFAKKAADAVARLARLEGLEAHARSALQRKE